MLAAVSGLAADTGKTTLVVDFGKELGKVHPRIGFLGGLRDEIPDETIEPLHPSLWRIGHQFRGRVKTGLNGAIDRVQHFGATYKLCMSDLIASQPADWAKYEADVKKLVAETGPRAKTILWEPVNEPDISYKPIDKYYELYAHAFKALREADKDAQITGPGFAFPSYDKYSAFLLYCREHKLECNALCWHFTGWDPSYPEHAKWKLGAMRDFIEQYKEQNIHEIDCDEWGAGPNKPGRLQPGRILIWFYYLEDVYKVDRACRANWGKADDYLGGIVDEKSAPYPVYNVYRWYGSTRDQTRVATEGNSATLSCLASKDDVHREILLGSVSTAARAVNLELRHTGLEKYKLTVQLIPNTNLDAPAGPNAVLDIKDYKMADENGVISISLDKVEENQAYRIVLEKIDK